jgi:hypothetical protein
LTDPVLLRPHHLLCLRFFEGKGYSTAFVNNTRAVLSRLEKDGRFTVVSGPDALCAACPHLAGGVCSQREKTDRYDTAAARFLGLRAGDAGDFAAFTKAGAAALQPRVCADCEWAEICAKQGGNK